MCNSIIDLLIKEEQIDKTLYPDFPSLFKMKGLLGTGAFGVVILVKNKLSKQKSALKIINKLRLSNEAIEILRNESIILQ